MPFEGIARYSSGRCSHTAPLLAHLGDYTPPADPAAARRLHTASPHAPRSAARSPPPLDAYLALAPPPLPLLAHLALLLLTYAAAPRSRPRCTRTPGCTHTSPPLVPTAPLLLSGCVASCVSRRCLCTQPSVACAPRPAAPQRWMRALPPLDRAPPLHPYPAAARAPRRSSHTRCPLISPSLVHPAAARLKHVHVPNHVPIATRTPLRRCMRTLLQLAHLLPAYFAAACTPSTPPRPAVARRHSRRTACAVPTSSDARNPVGMREDSDKTQGDEQWQ
ncbi:hypothetical protein B0H14DRAFT_3515972 [Mycena olivaceomarginata]|nr:hypothetical protein B0H14DRAFT_3515972 [Mycena olivaceomarginata]